MKKIKFLVCFFMILIIDNHIIFAVPEAKQLTEDNMKSITKQNFYVSSFISSIFSSKKNGSTSETALSSKSTNSRQRSDSIDSADSTHSIDSINSIDSTSSTKSTDIKVKKVTEDIAKLKSEIELQKAVIEDEISDIENSKEEILAKQTVINTSNQSIGQLKVELDKVIKNNNTFYNSSIIGISSWSNSWMNKNNSKDNQPTDVTKMSEQERLEHTIKTYQDAITEYEKDVTIAQADLTNNQTSLTNHQEELIKKQNSLSQLEFDQMSLLEKIKNKAKVAAKGVTNTVTAGINTVGSVVSSGAKSAGLNFSSPAIDHSHDDKTEKMTDQINELQDSCLEIEVALKDNQSNSLFKDNESRSLTIEEKKTLQDELKFKKDQIGKLKNELKQISDQGDFVQHQTLSSKKANELITCTYSPETRLVIAKMMHISLDIDPETGVIKNMPSIEMILKEADRNPSKEIFDIVSSSIKAVYLAEFIADRDPDYTKNTSQLHDFHKQLQSMLDSKVEFLKYKDTTLQDGLNFAHVGDLNIVQAFEFLKTRMKSAEKSITSINDFIKDCKEYEHFDSIATAASYLLPASLAVQGYGVGGVIGSLLYAGSYNLVRSNISEKSLSSELDKVKNMTLQELVNKFAPESVSALQAAHEKIDTTRDEKLSNLGSDIMHDPKIVSTFDAPAAIVGSMLEGIKIVVTGLSKEDQQSLRKDANQMIVDDFYDVNKLKTIFNFMHDNDSQATFEYNAATGKIENMSTVEEIIEKIKKIDKTNKKEIERSQDALESILNVIDVAIFDARYGNSFCTLGDPLKAQQLLLYQEMVLNTLTEIAPDYKNNFTDRIKSSFISSLSSFTSDPILHKTVQEILDGKLVSPATLERLLRVSGYNSVTISDLLKTLDISATSNKSIAKLQATTN